jgi:uncharacterized protein
MVIDFHTHFGPTCPWLEKAEYNVTPKMFKRFLDENSISNAVTFPNPQVGTKNYGKINKLISKAIKKDSRIIGFGRVDPREPKKALKELKHFEKLNLKGLKLHPVLECFHPKNEAFNPIYEYCEKNELPILFHSEKFNPFAKPETIEIALKDYKKLKVILGHFAGEESIDITKRNKQFYLVTSEVPSKQIVEKMVFELNNKRIIFGSDFPYRDFESEFKKISEADISKNSKDKIFFKNATKLLEI